MWFKNLRFYQLLEQIEVSSEEWQEKLATHESREAGALETYSYGWTSPLGRGGSVLALESSGGVMVCAKRIDKVVPAGVINDLVEEKVAELEDKDGRKVRRRERQEIREAVFEELLPRAFVQSSLTHAWIDLQSNWLVVDAASDKKAEELIERLRDSLGSLPVRPIEVAKAPASVMTAWLEGQVSEMGNFQLLDECELRDTSDEGGVVRCRHQDLASDEIRAHLNAGKQAVRLGLEWAERISFVLAEDLSLKRLRFADELREEADIDDEDPLVRFEAEFNLMLLEMRRFLPELLGMFGGLSKPPA